jgi:phage terminase large subunit-like protein
LPLVEVRQGFASLNPGSKELERLFQSGQLEHGNHPVLQWMFGNATIRKDPAGNIKPDKERAAEKIDGVGVMLKPSEPDVGAALNRAILERAGFA